MYKIELDKPILLDYNINITINCKIIYMITKIRISNFYSIGEKMELSFLKGGKKSTKDQGYFQYKNKEKISLINGFFGANASGKSNVLKAMTSIIRMIFNVATPRDAVNKLMLCQPHMHKKYEDKPTKLGMDFLINNNYYKYDLEIKNGNSITMESLFVTTLDKRSAKPKNIFKRTEKAGIIFGPEYLNLKDYLSIANIENYQTFISHLINNVSAKAVSDFIDYKKLVPGFLKTDGYDVNVPIPASIFKSAIKINSFDQKKQKEALKITQDIMSCFDETIESLDINNENNNISVKVKHKDFVDSIDIIDESAGTRELFCHIYNILITFKSGGIVIYDETNRYFHPSIEVALLSLFKSKEFNLKNSQLFFASHNHDTIDLLDISQTFIVEKSGVSSFVYKLLDLEDVKQRDNIKKKYHLGLFGGMPDVSLFDYKLKQLL